MPARSTMRSSVHVAVKMCSG